MTSCSIPEHPSQPFSPGSDCMWTFRWNGRDAALRYSAQIVYSGSLLSHGHRVHLKTSSHALNVKSWEPFGEKEEFWMLKRRSQCPDQKVSLSFPVTYRFEACFLMFHVSTLWCWKLYEIGCKKLEKVHSLHSLAYSWHGSAQPWYQAQVQVQLSWHHFLSLSNSPHLTVS